MLSTSSTSWLNRLSGRCPLSARRLRVPNRTHLKSPPATAAGRDRGGTGLTNRFAERAWERGTNFRKIKRLHSDCRFSLHSHVSVTVAALSSRARLPRGARASTLELAIPTQRVECRSRRVGRVSVTRSRTRGPWLQGRATAVQCLHRVSTRIMPPHAPVLTERPLSPTHDTALESRLSSRPGHVPGSRTVASRTRRPHCLTR